MSKITISIPHKLGEAEAKRRLEEKAKSVRDQYGNQVSNLRDEWAGNRLSFGFSAMGMKIAGELTVEPSQVQIQVDVPMMAMMFRGPIEAQARKELEQLLA